MSVKKHMLIINRKKTGLSVLQISYDKLQNIKKIQKKVIILKIRNFKFNLLEKDLILTCFEINNFKNRLLASIQIIIPSIKIEKTKIYYFVY